jgi:putative heme iron utilization protein
LERDSAAWTAGRERFLARFPGSRITFRLQDFTLYRLEFRQGLLVAGFGRAMEIAPNDIAKLATLGLD